VARWAPLVKRGPVLDLASGPGRHARFFAARGFEVLAVDRAPQSIPGVRFVQADLEDGTPWPLAGQRFGAVVVTNYLHRPLFEAIEGALAEGGVLIYETFMIGNERFGRPSNPAFLLRPGELREAFASLRVVAFEEGEVTRPKPAMTQRICAIRE
jgi:SAM-dependent methyltransferase